MITDGRSLLLSQAREAQRLNMGILTMPSYGEPFLSSAEANTVSWSEFKRAMHPLGVVHYGDDVAEYAITPKTIAWGVNDVNVFVGQNDRPIAEISDLTPEEGRYFMDINFSVARQIIQRGHGDSVQISVGFNPEDFSAGHHSVRRLHSHIRAIQALDLSRRQQFSWRELDRFDRMAFIEPFSSLYHDYINRRVAEGLLADVLVQPPEKRLGYTSLYVAGDAKPTIFDDLRTLYTGMKHEYNQAARIYTDGSKDIELDRYIPRPAADRQQLLAEFLASREGYYSEESVRALGYLCTHIVPAAPRNVDNPRQMSSTRTLYITRGFAGAINFALGANEDTLRIDFLPRVITTSGITKTIMGEQLPTVIAKTKSPATPEEHSLVATYHQLIVDILRHSFPVDNTYAKVEKQYAYQEN